MSDKVCPKCGEMVNSRGLAGHLRFKHKVKAGKPVRELLALAKPDEYSKVREVMDKLNDVTARARELMYQYHVRLLPIPREQLDKLLAAHEDEWNRLLKEYGLSLSDVHEDYVDAKGTRSVHGSFSYDPKEFEEAKVSGKSKNAQSPILQTLVQARNEWLDSMRRKYGK